MKKKIFNATHIAGKLYSQTLEMKESGANSKNPGTVYIAGTVDLATDDLLTNIVSTHFTYVTATTSKGTANSNFAILKGIIDGTYKSVTANGKDAAATFTIDSAIGLNEWYSDRTGTSELVSVKRNEGGFIRVANELDADESKRATFDEDIIIYNVKRVEADEEKEIKEHVVLSGYIMDFRKAFLPVEFSVYAPVAMDYYESLDASKSNPVFTRVKGVQRSQIIIRRVEEESAFGEPSVREFQNTRKDFVVTWGQKEVYNIGDDEDADITTAEIKQGLVDRNTTLATIKKNQEEYAARSAAANSAFATNNNSEELYDF